MSIVQELEKLRREYISDMIQIEKESQELSELFAKMAPKMENELESSIRELITFKVNLRN